MWLQHKSQRKQIINLTFLKTKMQIQYLASQRLAIYSSCPLALLHLEHQLQPHTRKKTTSHVNPKNIALS